MQKYDDLQQAYIADIFALSVKSLLRNLNVCDGSTFSVATC